MNSSANICQESYFACVGTADLGPTTQISSKSISTKLRAHVSCITVAKHNDSQNGMQQESQQARQT